MLPVALGVLGAALRLWQYSAGASLWADEANLALNIVDRPLGRLLGPLDYRQMAPPGWLLLQKAAITLFGDGEHALRLIPLLGSLATLPLAWHVARRILRPGVEPALALGLVATAVPLIFFAAQVKPYATDVAAALLLLALALAVRRAGPGGGRLLRLGLAGTLLPWLSYPALLVSAGLLAALVATAILERDRARLRSLVPVALAWAASAAGAIAWARGTLGPGDVEYLRQFWGRWLMPLPPRSLQDLGWPVARLTTVFGGGGLRYPAPGVFVALAALGTFALWRRARDHAWLLLGPILATFAAAALQVYPFSPRLVLFLFPGFLILTAAGPGALASVGRAAGRRAATIATLLCAGLALYGLVRDPPPYAPEPLKPVLLSMRRAWQPGDRVYVYYGAEKAFVYYARRLGFAERRLRPRRLRAGRSPRLPAGDRCAPGRAPHVAGRRAPGGRGGRDPPRLPRPHRDAPGRVPGRRAGARSPDRRVRPRLPLRPLGSRAPGGRHGGHVPAPAERLRRAARRLVLPPGGVAALKFPPKPAGSGAQYDVSRPRGQGPVTVKSSDS